MAPGRGTSVHVLHVVPPFSLAVVLMCPSVPRPHTCSCRALRADAVSRPTISGGFPQPGLVHDVPQTADDSLEVPSRPMAFRLVRPMSGPPVGIVRRPATTTRLRRVTMMLLGLVVSCADAGHTDG